MTPEAARAGVLVLARHTGWSEASICAMPISRFLWWIEGLNDGAATKP